MRRTSHPTSAVAATVLVACLGLTACDAAEDTAKNVFNDAACSVANSAVDEAGRQAGRAVDDIGADPQSAQRELGAIRDTLTAAEKSVDGDLKAKITDAKEAVEKLLGQAQDAAEGVEVDTTEVDDARAELDSAIDDVKDVC